MCEGGMTTAMLLLLLSVIGRVLLLMQPQTMMPAMVRVVGVAASSNSFVHLFVFGSADTPWFLSFDFVVGLQYRLQPVPLQHYY